MLCLNEEEISRKIARAVDETWIDTISPEGEVLNLVLNAILHDMWNGPDSINDRIEKAEHQNPRCRLDFRQAGIREPCPIGERSGKAINRQIRRSADKEDKT